MTSHPNGNPKLHQLSTSAIEGYPFPSNPSTPSNPSLKLVLASLGLKEGLGEKDGVEGIVNYLIDILTRCGYLLDRQINAVEAKHEREGGYNEKLLRKRLEYKKFQDLEK